MKGAENASYEVLPGESDPEYPVYPNPAGGFVLLRTPGFEHGQSLSDFDSTGR